MASSAPRNALSRVNALTEAEQNPEPERLATLFAKLRKKAVPDAVVPENLAGWTAAFAAMIQGGTRPREIEQAIRFGFAKSFWSEKLTTPSKLRDFLASLLRQSGDYERKHAAAQADAKQKRRDSGVQADREQERRATRAQTRTPAEPEQATEEGVTLGLESLRAIIGRGSVSAPPKGEEVRTDSRR